MRCMRKSRYKGTAKRSYYGNKAYNGWKRKTATQKGRIRLKVWTSGWF